MTNTAIICLSSPEKLNQYKILQESSVKHCPGIDSLLYYGGSDHISEMGNKQIVHIDHWVEAAKKTYNDDWLIYCALRPRAILDAFLKGYDRVILLGADTEFFSYPYEFNFSEDCFMTPYTFDPYPDEKTFPQTGQILEVGQMNADCVGFNKNPRTIKFLTWLQETLENGGCYYRGKIGLDQFFFQFAFSMLESVKVCRHPGYNVQYSNLFDRGMQIYSITTTSWSSMYGSPYKEETTTPAHSPPQWYLEKDGKQFPLVLFHFAGFIPGPQMSKHGTRYQASGEILEFFDSYGKKL